MSSEQEPTTIIAQEPTTVEKLRGLPWSIASNATNTVFVQFTFFGSVFVLFLSALGLSKGEMGFLLSLLPFFGIISLFVAPIVERYGYKRIYVTFFGLRNLAAVLLMFTPFVLNTFGRESTLLYVSIVVATFSLLRAIGMTASIPWLQEYVPNAVRGKYTARNNIFTTLTAFAAVTTAGIVLDRSTGLTGYVFLLAVGVVFGLISVWLSTFIPGGAPRPQATQGEARKRELGVALHDRNYLLYLAGVAVYTLSTVPLGSFLPLFMQEQVGLNEGAVVWLQMGSLAGGLLAGPAWGWAADRYGSKPVMLLGVLLRATLPLIWMSMPRHSPWSLSIALGTALLQGLADIGWAVGSARLLYVSVVPQAKRSDYLAIYNAWNGIVGGTAALIGGVVLQFTQSLDGRFLIFNLDPYLPLFLMGLTLPLMGALLFRTIRLESDVSVGEFAGIFLRGNPFVAVTSLVRFHLARDEPTTLEVTARLGQARSPLTVEEMLEALSDPRFNVRFEAIQSIARGASDERLIRALEEILTGPDPALSVMAAWALGRLGDERAIDTLRAGLDARHRSVKAHSSRALAALGDAEIGSLLLDRLVSEPDYGLRIAYASALGQLHSAEATPEILQLLHDSEHHMTRLELALALARIVGDEHHFIQLLRQVRLDPGTAVAQELAALKRRAPLQEEEATGAMDLLDTCANAFAHNRMGEAAVLLGQFLRGQSWDGMDESCRAVLETSARQLAEEGAARQEYLLLALHALQACWNH